MNDEKNCLKCKTFSSKSNFHKDISEKGGYRPESVECIKQYHYRDREK